MAQDTIINLGDTKIYKKKITTSPIARFLLLLKLYPKCGVLLNYFILLLLIFQDNETVVITTKRATMISADRFKKPKDFPPLVQGRDFIFIFFPRTKNCPIKCHRPAALPPPDPLFLL